ncbi:MAG: phosphomannomutase/phosphoglucomutase [Rhodospirillales bacterium]|nr:phosphomannomutase/phosphoglucomutase [Rhodospirillales bacterium]MSP81188.1 phosphomannomutase/phosphoglucomutase [Rhodospirillales bacterium]
MAASGARTLDSTLLREYDIRGVVGETLSAADARVIGRAFGSMLARDRGRTVAVGHDGRLTSPELEKSLIEGLTATGMSVTRVGLGPTPMLYYAAHELEVDGAVMVTGSHNPPAYNGFKFSRRGKPFYGADIQELGRVATKGEFAAGVGVVGAREMLDAYVERLARDFVGTRALRVAWDPGNGAAGDAVTRLARRLPGRHTVINGTIDGRFPAHHPDPTVESNLAQLKESVAQGQCDLGFAFDGDGDRIGVVDGRGRVLWGDQILVLLAAEVLKDEPHSTIIADVKASQVFFDEIRRLGGQPLMWKTGHSLIKAKMQELQAPLAGEMSGHIFFRHRYYGFDDALYAAVRLLSVVASASSSLAEMRDAMPQMMNTPEIRFDCPENRKFKVIEEVRERLKPTPGIEINDVDGVRVTTADGWWLLRASNTQAVLVARCESRTEAGLVRLKAALARQISLSNVKIPDLG